jgi:ABC-type branched-subunit amino acid transport system ATPase component
MLNEEAPVADADVDATAPGHALELRRVVKSFGPVVALRSGSLVLDRGSIHALIGENGAGKSTLVKVIAGRTAAMPEISCSRAHPSTSPAPRSRRPPASP